jgi:hypothetical protein
VIDDPDGRCPPEGAYGGKVAAPIFKQLGERLIPYLGTRPTIDNDAAQSLALEGGVR